MPRYQVRELAFGFEIAGADRTPIKVMAEETCWAINHGGCLYQIGLFEIGELASLCAKIAISNWSMPKKSGSSFFVEKWMHDLTRKTFCKIISAQFKRIRVKLDPTVINVQKNVFHSTMKAGEISINADFYKRASKYLLKDIISYRPAAVALRYIASPFSIYKFSLPSEDVAEFEKHEKYQDPLAVINTPYPGAGYCLPLNRAMDLLEDWRALYSPDRIPYTALNRTLMNCPALSAFALGRLHKSFLERPVFNRLELMLNIEGSNPQSRHKKVMIHSTEMDIKKSLKLVSSATHRDLSSKTFSSILFLIRYLNDYPEQHLDGRIVGLARKSIRWHQEQANITKEDIISKYGEMAFPSLPIPLPKIDDDKINLRFLSSVAEVAIEAESMGHCIGNYVDKAMNGESFLFHLDHLPSGTSASIEVNSVGEVVQSCGPRNCRNKATTTGSRLLKSWGRNIPSNARLLKVNNQQPAPAPF